MGVPAGVIAKAGSVWERDMAAQIRSITVLTKGLYLLDSKTLKSVIRAFYPSLIRPPSRRKVMTAGVVVRVAVTAI